MDWAEVEAMRFKDTAFQAEAVWEGGIQCFGACSKCPGGSAVCRREKLSEEARQ